MRNIIFFCFMMLAVVSGCAQPNFEVSNPANLGPNVNSPYDDGSPNISADGRSLYFDSLRPGGLGDWDIWLTQTTTPHVGWGKAVPLPGPVNSRYGDSGPCITADGLTLYFASSHPGGYGNFDIWVTTRKTTEEPWEKPVNLGPAINSRYYDNHPSISADGLSLYFDSNRPNASGFFSNNDIYVTRRETINDDWSPPENLGYAINTKKIEYSPDISRDGLTLYYDSRITDRDICVTKRKTKNDDWDDGEHLGPPFNTTFVDTDPSNWNNNSILYFVSDRLGGSGRFDIWQIRNSEKQR